MRGQALLVLLALAGATSALFDEEELGDFNGLLALDEDDFGLGDAVEDGLEVSDYDLNNAEGGSRKKYAEVEVNLEDANEFGKDMAQNDLDLMIHVVPHSHVDAGWTETMETMLENHAKVILERVLDQLDGDLKRRFVWAEVYFFRNWYEGLQQGEKNRVRRAVKEGQLEFVNGGLVEHDESLTPWEFLVEQLREGHEWLEQHFGVRPTVAWQIDAAGHSDATPAILSQMGIDSLFLGKLHYRMKQQFKSQKNLEFIWRGADLSAGRKSSTSSWRGGDVFTHVLYQGFSSPEGFDFESGKGVRQVTNAKRRAERLVHDLREWAISFRTHHLFVPFGDRVRFMEADKQFSNMEKLIRHVNEKVPGVQMRFSTASEYVRAVRETTAVSGLEFSQYVGDFQPYADRKDGYWSGVYSTRMALKDACREIQNLAYFSSTSFVLARARATALGDAPPIKSISNGHIETDRQSPPPQWDGKLFKQLQNARTAALLMTHHHAITGTIRQQVLSEYVKLMRDAQGSGNAVYEASVAQLLTRRGGSVRPTLTSVPFNLLDDTKKESDGGTLQHPIVLFNSDASPRLEAVHIYVGKSWEALQHVQIVDAAGKSLESQLVHFLSSPNKKKNKGSGGNNKKQKGKSKSKDLDEVEAKIYLSFVAEVPPLGFKTYFCFISSARERMKMSNQLENAATPTTFVFRLENGRIKASSAGQHKPNGLSDDTEEYDDMILERDLKGNTRGGGGGGQGRLGRAAKDDGIDGSAGLKVVQTMSKNDRMLILENDIIQVQIETATGMLHSVLDKRTSRNTLLNQQFWQYPGTRSGAHLFRPEPARAVDFDDALIVAITKGPLFEQVQVIGHSGIGQFIRVWKYGQPENKADDSSRMRGSSRKQTLEVQGVGVELRSNVELKLVVSAELGMDTAVRFETSMDTDGFFFTDNPLGDLVKRTTHREAPLPSNVYPATSTAALRDSQATPVTRLGQVLSLVAKTPFAASSPFSESGMGTLELILHRNHQNDDGRGLNEALQDFSTTHFSCLLSVGVPRSILAQLSTLRKRMQRPLKPLFALETRDIIQIVSRENWVAKFNTEGSFLRQELPRGLEIASISAMDAVTDDVLLQLRHDSMAGNNKAISAAFVELFDSTISVSGVQEVKLGGESREYKRFGAPFRGSSASPMSRNTFEYLEVSNGPPIEAEKDDENKMGKVSLGPNEIRSFLLQIRALDSDGGHAVDASVKTPPGRVSSSKVETTRERGRKQPDPPNLNQMDDEAFLSEELQKHMQRESRKTELEAAAAEHRSNIEAMRRRVHMYKSNIEQLLLDVDKFESQGKHHLKEATVQDLRSAESSLQHARSSLESSKKDLMDVIEQIKELDSSYRVDSEFIFEDEVLVRTTEAKIHGAVAGAAAMLLLLVAGNWVFSGGLKLVRAYVPISVRFLSSAPPSLPTHKDT